MVGCVGRKSRLGVGEGETEGLAPVEGESGLGCTLDPDVSPQLPPGQLPLEQSAHDPQLPQELQLHGLQPQMPQLLQLKQLLQDRAVVVANPQQLLDDDQVLATGRNATRLTV